MSKEPEPCAPRRAPRCVVDWHQAAELLAQGMTIEQVATRIGCPRSALARRCRDDPTFQSWIAPAREVAAETEADVGDLRPTVQRVIVREVRSGSVRVALWLADRLKLVTPPNERTPDEELRQMLSALTTEELREFQNLRDEP